MVNILWGFFIIIGITYSLLTGNISIINDEIIHSSKAALNLMLDMIPLLVVWMGLMRIAEDSGLLTFIARKLSFLLIKLFPNIPQDNKALGYIASNVAVNMAGLGSAATPFGLKAMEELQKLNDNKNVATPAMITFLVLNTGGVTIIPTTIISMRLFHGSINPTEIIPTCILCTLCSSLSGLLLDYFIRRRHDKS